MQKRTLNEKVNITGWYFRNRKGLSTYPKRMEYQGSTYTFSESGLQYLIKKGESVLRIFDVTDGASKFRLMSDEAQLDWTLVTIEGAV